MTITTAVTRGLTGVGLVAGLLLLTGCGGGGGGSGGKGGTGPVADDSVSLVGFSFRLGTGAVVDTPPFEDLTTTPPKLGASLNTVVVFKFDGVPEGPFDHTTLPVFTTPAEVTPLVTPLGDATTILAKGSYHLVGATVEFRPFVPSAPLQINLSAPAEAVPGLLPGSVYTARVSVGPNALGNLDGVGGEVKFGTTSNVTAYYPTDVGADDPPALVSSEPADGAEDFFPGVFSTTPLGAMTPTFPDGDDSFLLTFDKVLAPTEANIEGADLDGDGLVDPSFFLRARGTQLLLSHEVPADALGGGHAAFAAVSGYEPGATPDPDGGDVVLHAGSALPDPDAGLTATPSALAIDREPGLLWAVLPVEGGPDQLTVADHVLGDPAFALLAEDGSGLAGAPAALDTGLDDIGALTSTLDGRLLAYDRTTRRIHELLPTVVRRRPEAGQSDILPPVLVDLALGDGVVGFLGEPLSDAGSPADPDVLDLAQAPSGELYALARLGGSALPSVIRLQGVDSDLNGSFDPDDGTFSGEPSDVLLDLASDIVDICVEREGSLLALDRDADAIQRVDLASGATEMLVADVAGFGTLAPGEPSPAVAFEVGFIEFDVDTTLVSNGEAGAVVRLQPWAILPPGRQLDVMMRQSVSTLYGTSLANADPEALLSSLGAARLLSVTTAEPLAGVSAAIDDAFLEGFDTKAFEDTSPTNTNPPAEWALSVAGGGTSGGLRASVGVAETAMLGDFLPQDLPTFDPSKAWGRTNQEPPDADLDTTFAGYRVVFLDTDAQNFPLPDGSTPGVTVNTTVIGGRFTFRDIIIPESVHVIAKGTRPLVLTATRTVQINGLIDLRGTNGFSDDTFDSGFLPVPGGPGGAAGGRGGDGQPSRFDPNGPGTLNQYVTPEAGERGFGPVVGQVGTVSFAQVGGHGGVSTVGYDPTAGGYPKVPNADNNENHRPPGGGGGSFYFRGDISHEGAGTYLVQSDSTWFPFTKCVFNDKIRDALYGNDENFYCGGTPTTPLQCVYMVGSPTDPSRFKPGANPGDELFGDGDFGNDYIGPGGEVTVLFGGQGGGGGGTRVDSMRHGWWSIDQFGSPLLPPIGPPCYPKLFGGVYFAPSMWDAKGAGAGGGGGAVQIRSFGDIIIGRTGHIDASGGHGGGGEVVKNCNFAGGGGGGSGGPILLQAAGKVVLEADATHVAAGFAGLNGDQGASLDVTGGYGRDARTNPLNTINFDAFRYEVTRSDAAQGGFGLIQLQSGVDGGLPEIQQGAFAFARKRAEFKAGKWTGVPQDFNGQSGHLSWAGPNPDNYPPNELRYIDLMHYRHHQAEGEGGPLDRFYVLNGSFPPSIPSATGLNGMGPLHEYPAGSGQLWWDTKMIEYPEGSGKYVVQDPKPEWIFKTYNGYEEQYNDLGQLVKVTEINFDEDHPDFPDMPGTTYVGEEIPMSIKIVRPDGTPPMVEVDGELQWVSSNLIDRLPMVNPAIAPAPFGTVSHGTSRWLDYAGVALRARSDSGLAPPFFEAFQGTYNAAVEAVPAGKEGAVVTTSQVPSKPATYVKNSGPPPFDPGLFGNGAPPDPVYNDISVDSPDVNEQNAITDNATVKVRFQGAYPVRSGSHVPDPDTISAWVTDLTELSGYPLVRFRVAFDLGADPQSFPFGVDSHRPVVDELRLRATY